MSKMYAMPKPESSGTSKFLKLVDGDNRLRIVSPIVAGYEGWNRSGGTAKVYRQEQKFTQAEMLEYGFDDNKQTQFFGAVVWSYNQKSFVTATFKQSAIKTALYELDKDEDWGDLTTYDITVIKTGSDLNTKYSVMAKPKKAFDAADVSELYYRLEELFEGGDPLNVPE